MWAKFVENDMPTSLEEARERVANSTLYEGGFVFLGNTVIIMKYANFCIIS